MAWALCWAIRQPLRCTPCEWFSTRRWLRGKHVELAWKFSDGTVTGLRLRDGVAVPTDGSSADETVTLDHETWAKVLGGKLSLPDALESGAIATDNQAAVQSFLGCFDIASLKS